MSGPNIGRAALEREEQAATERVAELARRTEQLEAALEQTRAEQHQAIGGLLTVRRVLGIPPTGIPPAEPPAQDKPAKAPAKPRRKRPRPAAKK